MLAYLSACALKLCLKLSQKLFGEFRDKVRRNANKLFVMVVDEAHHAAVRRGAHDAFANDFRCQTANGEKKRGAWKPGYTDVPGEWDSCDNLVIVLVSATPACVLTADSRLPRQYYVPRHLPAQQKELAGAVHLQRFSIIRSDGAAPSWMQQHECAGSVKLRRLI